MRSPELRRVVPGRKFFTHPGLEYLRFLSQFVFMMKRKLITDFLGITGSSSELSVMT